MIDLKAKVLVGSSKVVRVVAGIGHYLKDGETRLGYFINDELRIDGADFIDESRVKKYTGSKKK